MANKNIKEVEGGEVTSLSDTDGFEIDTGASSVWIQWTNIKTLIASFIATLTATWTNKTLTTPTIGDFTNATHAHNNAASGGIPDPLHSGQMANGKINVTVVSNDLVLALKTLAGSDPSASDPVKININGTVRTVTAATSITLADATNWFNAGAAELATKEIDYFVCAVWDSNSSIVAIAPARIPYGRLVSDFSATTTNEKHLGNYANFTSTDDVAVIGRFAATLSAAAGHVWTVPTFTNANLIQHPVYETRWLTWTPTLTGFSADPASGIYRYLVRSRDTILTFRQPNAGTSNATGFTMTAPFTSNNIANMNWSAIIAYTDNGVSATTPGRIVANANSNVLSTETNMAGGVWTNANGKGIRSATILQFEIG